MSASAVKEFCRLAMAGTSLTGTNFSTLDTFRQRPKREKLGKTAAAIIGRTTYKETRLSGSRGAGQKKRHYDVEVLVFATAKDEQKGGDDFDTLLERISFTLLNSAVPAEGIDPTGNSSNSIILSVAEEIDVETYDPITTGGTDSMVRFYGVVKPKVTEIIQA